MTGLVPQQRKATWSPDRRGDTCAAYAADVIQRGPSGQIPAVAITRRLIWSAGARSLPSGMSRWCIGKSAASFNPHSPGGGRGERFSATRFSLTGADSSPGIPRGTACAPRRQAKNAIRYRVLNHAIGLGMADSPTEARRRHPGSAASRRPAFRSRAPQRP
jgi:hypothetical protein